MYRKKRGYSCVELADTYYKNDPEKKLYFYNKACEFGFERACYEIKNTAKQKENIEKQKNSCDEKRTAMIVFRQQAPIKTIRKNAVFLRQVLQIWI